MSTYAIPQSVVERQQIRARARRPQPCGQCREWTRTVLYMCGWRCEACAERAGLTPVHGAPGAYPEFLRNRRRPAGDA